MRLNEQELTRIMRPDTYLLYETRPNASSNASIRLAVEIAEDVRASPTGRGIFRSSGP